MQLMQFKLMPLLMLVSTLLQGCEKKPATNEALKVSPLVTIKIPPIHEPEAVTPEAGIVEGATPEQVNAHDQNHMDDHGHEPGHKHGQRSSQKNAQENAQENGRENTQQTVHAKGSHEHHAHAHGAGKLEIIADGNNLMIKVNLPSADVVGFEHSPTGEAEKAQLNSALQTLQAPDSLFVMNAPAGCSLKQGTVATALLNTQMAQAEHADFDATYEWHCAKPAEIKSIGITLFSQFKSLHTLKADYIINGKQGGAELKPSHLVTLSF